MLAYLIEANAVITFASTGVRGMKYDGHPLIGFHSECFAHTSKQAHTHT